MKDLVFRKARSQDVERVTQMMQGAFKIWEPIGFNVASLTSTVVASFLVPDGYVAENKNGEIIGCVCIRFAEPNLRGTELQMPRAHRVDTTTVLDASTVSYLPQGLFAYAYGLAVDPLHNQEGLGQRIGDFVESEAKMKSCKGLLFETAESAQWLVDWYRRSGFEIIGRSPREHGTLIFMLKKYL